jgi:site-specific DNA-cytosine methylase
MPRVLIACEMSGRVRTQFALRGWDAWSADLLPDESEMWTGVPQGRFNRHYQGDVLTIIRDDWDLIIAHPPCDHLGQVGARYWKEKQADGRQQTAAKFFKKMIELPCPKTYVVVENPRGIMSQWREPDQKVQPWWFGDPLKKETCLWYRGAWGPSRPMLRDYVYDELPHLVATHTLADYPDGVGRTCTGGGSWRTDTKNGLTGMNKNWEDSQGRARRRILRSITPEGFARAAAEQWGSYVEARRP